MDINLDMALEIQLILGANAVYKQKQHSTLLWCRLYSTIRTELMDDIYTVAPSFTYYSDEKL